MVQKLLRRAAVEQATGLHGGALYELVAQGKFPKPVPLGEALTSRRFIGNSDLAAIACHAWRAAMAVRRPPNAELRRPP